MMYGICEGMTNAGQHCELPAGHYPDTPHMLHLHATPDDTSWISWTDAAMTEFRRVADEMRSEGKL